MIAIKHPSDLLQVDIPRRHLSLIQDCFRLIQGDAYDPDIDGYIVYVEAGDDLGPVSLLELNRQLRDIPFEGSQYHPSARCHEAVLCTNNSFALTFIIPDEHISEDTREVLLALN